jgi:hypothetical protein
MPTEEQLYRSMKYGVGSQDAGGKGSLKDIARFGAQMLPGSEIAREVGVSDLEPTISEDIKTKRYMDALLKAIGVAGDVGTGTGAVMMTTGAGAVPGALLIGASQAAKRASKMVRTKRLKKHKKLWDDAKKAARKESDDPYQRDRDWADLDLDEPMTERHIELFLKQQGYTLKEPGVKKIGDTYDFVGDKIVAYTSHANKTGFSQTTFEVGIPFNELRDWAGY